MKIIWWNWSKISEVQKATDVIEELKEKGTWMKDEIVKLYFGFLPKFAHKETSKYLDQRI